MKMSKRDFFAGLALPGVITRINGMTRSQVRALMEPGEKTATPAVARAAYEVADAMLQERARSRPSPRVP